jgi:hypothetical protein
MKNAAVAFLGKPGTTVPVVDPEDLRTVWRISEEINAGHPDGLIAAGTSVLTAECKSGADIKAVSYRSMMLGLLRTLSDTDPEALELKPWFRNGAPSESAFQAMAVLSLRWPNPHEAQSGQPLDLNEFRRLCEAA